MRRALGTGLPQWVGMGLLLLGLQVVVMGLVVRGEGKPIKAGGEEGGVCYPDSW